MFFKNVNDFCNNSNHWKGFQVKAFILNFSSFKELILCDADVIIQQNPEILFNDNNYLETGTYFFKDLDLWQFSKLNNKLEQLKQKLIFRKFHNLTFLKKRKEWIKNILPEKKQNFLLEWDYIYLDEIPQKPVKEALQESGVVLMNKEKQKDSIQNIYNLNDSHKETYQYVCGDKETFWIGCIMANQPYYFNPSPGYFSKLNNKLSHNYNGEVFFSQKG